MPSSRLPRWLTATLVVALLLTPTMAGAAPSDETAQRIAALELEIATLVTDRDAAVMVAAVANEEFLRAQETLDSLAGETIVAREAAAEARESVEEARRSLGEVAQQAYRNSNPLESLTPFVDSDDFARAMHASAYLGQLGKQRDATLSDFQALELVADTLEGVAERAYQAEQDATADLEAKADVANESAAAANVLLLTSQDRRESLITQLAAERQVEVAAERERQDRLEQERQERSAQASQPAGPIESAAPSTSTPPAITAPPVTIAPTPAPTPSPAPVPTPTPSPTPTPAPVPTPTPTPTPAPTPTPTPDPKPVEPSYTVTSASGTYYAINDVNIRKGPDTSYASVGTLSRHTTVAVTGKANGWYRIGTDRWVSGTFLSAGEPPKAQPKPDPVTPAPAPSAPAGVETAISYALAQVGKPYVWGTAGPSTFDCSGLTHAAYRQIGITISRSSGAQYNSGTRVPLSDAKRGDLMFWSSNGAASGIYHVAIYLGGGMKVHARDPSWGVQHDAVYYANIMPSVVRLG